MITAVAIAKQVVIISPICAVSNYIHTPWHHLKRPEIKQVKSTALLSVHITSGKGTERNHLKPCPSESPIVTLHLQILGCSNLLAKDHGGTTDL